jgi:hypothetical protein
MKFMKVHDKKDISVSKFAQYMERIAKSGSEGLGWKGSTLRLFSPKIHNNNK